MDNPLVSIQIVVFNGERYIRRCLRSVRTQTYDNYDVTILDNASTDGTLDIIKNEFSEYRVIENNENVGMWPGQEILLSKTDGKYVVVLSVDVILEKDFIRNAVRACEENQEIDGVQAKIYQYSLIDLQEGTMEPEKRFLDTCGFAMTHSRKVINIGHGERDTGHSEKARVFGVEGAVPFFRRSALQDCKIHGHLIDPDYFWYGDDLDLVWRMTLFGHVQTFIPDVIAWHDRATTKGAAKTPVLGQLRRLGFRRSIPIRKRRLDWSNVRFTIIKNDYIINILRDLPFILARELAVLAYTLIFEPRVLTELGRFLRLMPVMLKRRREVMRKAVLDPNAMHRFFI